MVACGFVWLSRSRLPIVVGLLLAMAWPARSVTAMTAEITEATAVATGHVRLYAVQHGARNVAVEAPDKIWFTAPDAGGLGVVTVLSDDDDAAVRYRVEFYSFGANSQPYDLDISGEGVVWFTLRGIRAVGRLTIATRNVSVYTLPTFGSAPTGIDVAPDGQIWIAGTNGRLLSFDPVSEEFLEYVFPDEMLVAPRVEDIRYQTSRLIWFSLPDADAVGVYNSVRGRFFQVPTGEPAPTRLTLDSQDRLWVTAYDASRVGRYSPTTVGNWFWYNAPSTDSGPAGIVTFETGDTREIWFAQSRTGTLGRLRIVGGFTLVDRITRSLAIPSGAPWGMAVASDRHLWVADPDNALLAEVLPPYFDEQWLPAVLR